MPTAIPATHSQYRRTGVTKAVETGLELVKDVPVPKPGRGQVLVRIHAVSLNYRDVAHLKGQYPAPFTPKGVPVSDGAGEIVALGDDVSQWKVGARIAITCHTHPGGLWRYFENINGLGFDIDGVLTQYIVVDQVRLVDIGSLSYEEAATLPCAGVTAWNALYGNSTLQAGRTVLVQGTGGVSILAAQFALAAGARVIATSSSDDKLTRVEGLGVAKQDLINYKSNPEWGKRALQLTNDRGVDYVVEVGGASTISQSLASIRVGGEIALIGFLGGLEGSGFNPLEVLIHGAIMRGVFIGGRQMFQDMLESIHHNKIRPVIDKVFSFEQAMDAFNYLESGSHFGKVVIKVA